MIRSVKLIPALVLMEKPEFLPFMLLTEPKSLPCLISVPNVRAEMACIQFSFLLNENC